MGLIMSKIQDGGDGHIGFAADGFPIYSCCGYGKNLKSSYRIKEGYRDSGPLGKYDGSYVEDYEYVKGLGDLDECNGVFGRTKEHLQGVYFYVITKDFPNVPRCFKGTPNPSFKKIKHPRNGGKFRNFGENQKRYPPPQRHRIHQPPR